MVPFRKRLASLFGAKKAEGQPGSPAGGTPKSSPSSPAIPEKAITTAAEAASLNPQSSNQSLQNENSGVQANPPNNFNDSGLFLEIKKNSEIAKTPWSGKLTSFQTSAWDHKSSEVDLLPASVIEELNEAYVYIRLANRLVWLSEDLGRSSQDIAENYVKMCRNVAERLDRAMTLIAEGPQQDSKPEKAAVKQAGQAQKPEAVVEKAPKPEVVIEEVQKAEVVIGKTQKPEAAGVEQTSQNQKPAATVEKTKQIQTPKEAESRKAAPESRLTKSEKRKVTANLKAKAQDEEEDKQYFKGISRLLITQGAQGTQITTLLNLLTETQEIKVLSSGGAAGQRSWVILSTEKPLPLIQILRSIPVVKKVSKQVSKQGNEIEVTLTSS